MYYTYPLSDRRLNKLHNLGRLHALQHRQLHSDTNQSWLQESTNTKGWSGHQLLRVYGISCFSVPKKNIF